MASSWPSRTSKPAAPRSTGRATDAVTRDVFVNRNGRAEKVPVEVGIADDTYQEIVSGLSAGDEVVTGPDRVLRALEDGDRIEVAENKRDNASSIRATIAAE